MKNKQRHQVKSRWYYIFWGAATVSVFAGQIYVGNGFRKMADSINEVFGKLDSFGILIKGRPPTGRIDPDVQFL